MQLLIAEKREAAFAIAKALFSPNFKEEKHYFFGNTNLYITWLQGHLLTQKEPGEIDEKWEPWDWETLPIIPNEIPLKPIQAHEIHLYKVHQMARSSHQLINAMDAAIEGEAIMGNFINHFKLNNKPILRFWTPSLESSAVREAFNNMKPQSHYENLKNAGFARSRSDYLIGMNSTRALTLLNNGATLPMGRLIAALLAIIVNRDKQRAYFEEESYFTLKAAFEPMIELKYKGGKIKTNEEVKRIVEVLESGDAQLDYSDATKETYPPPLFNLTDVTVIANKKLNLSPIKTSRLLQSLYLKRVISYPRTNSRYVTKNEITSMRATFHVLSAYYPKLYEKGNIDLINEYNERIVKPESINDHHAIIPTLEIPRNLNSEEEMLYQLIVERFFLQCQPPVKKEVRTVTVKNGAHEFTKSYSRTLDVGWKGLVLDFTHDTDDEEAEECGEQVEDIPEEVTIELPKFDRGPVKFIMANHNIKKTKPPSLYTQGTLMKQMENIASIVESPRYKAALQGCGIGTSATRAETINKLLEIGYIELEKNKVQATGLAASVVELLEKTVIGRQLLTPEFTGQWEMELNRIKEGSPPQQFEQSVESFCVALIDELRDAQQLVTYEHQCPKCQSGLSERPKQFRCTKCDFFIWRKQNNKMLSNKMLADLLKNEETSVLTFISKKNTKYKARLAFPIENGRCQLKFLNK